MVVDKKPYRHRMKLRRKVRCSGCTHWHLVYLASGVGSGVLIDCPMCGVSEPHNVYTLKGSYRIVEEDD